MVGVWLWWRRSPPPALTSGACRGCNVLLITDRHPATRSGRRVRRRGGLTPTLDRLASEGVRVTRAYSAAPLTLPSHASILTAVSPPVHGLRANGLFRLGPNLPTLATVLQGGRLPDRRLRRLVRARRALRPQSRLRRLRRSIWRKARRRPGRGSRTPRRGGRAAGGRLDHQGQLVSALSPQPSALLRLGAPLRSPRALSRARALRIGARTCTTRRSPMPTPWSARLLAELRAAGRLDRTLIMVAADHGESLGEHGERTHGVFVYDATMRVPWIVAGSITAGSGFRVQGSGGAAIDSARAADRSRADGARPGRRRRAARSSKAVDRCACGVRLSRSGAPPDRTAYLEAMDANLTRNWAPLTGGRHARLQADRSADPRALRPARRSRRDRQLVHARRRAGAHARRAAARHHRSLRARGSPAEKTTLSAEARQRLQALGYVAHRARIPRLARLHRSRRSEIADRSGRGPQSRARGFNAGSRDAGMAAVARDHAAPSDVLHGVRHFRGDAAQHRRSCRRDRDARGPAPPRHRRSERDGRAGRVSAGGRRRSKRAGGCSTR